MRQFQRGYQKESSVGGEGGGKRGDWGNKRASVIAYFWAREEAKQRHIKKKKNLTTRGKTWGGMRGGVDEGKEGKSS